MSESKDILDQPEIAQAGTSIHSQTESVFSPIQGVPLDVLHEIVVYCLPIHPTTKSASPIISTLSQVSSTWRAAVLLSPRPWSTLFLTVHYDDDLTKCAQMVTRWFQRARSSPLSFFLNIMFTADLEDITRVRTFLADLSSIMLRVGHFGLHAELTDSLLRSFFDLEWELPRLKILDLFSHSSYDVLNPVAFSCPLFYNTPNLVRVAIQNAITSARDIQHVVPWPQLTRIAISYKISIYRWIEIMNTCPMLRRCDVAIGRDEATSSPLDSCLPKGTPHNLERLDLETNVLVPFLKPLSLYNLPSLHTLYVFYSSEPFPGTPSPQNISALRNLQEFSFNPGQEKISSGHLTYLVDILREMVNLKMLEIQQATKDFMPLFEAMSFKSPEAPILPQLSTLQIWCTPFSVVQLGEKDEDLDPLIAMLSSRTREDAIPVGCKRLQNFIVGVQDHDVYERTKVRFGSLVGKLAPDVRFKISILRDFRFEQPEGWTYPISDENFVN